MPQEILIPIDRKLKSDKPNREKDVIIPAEVIKKPLLIANFSLEFFKTDKSFIDSTGSTQGITFKIKPPTNATKKM